VLPSSYGRVLNELQRMRWRLFKYTLHLTKESLLCLDIATIYCTSTSLGDHSDIRLFASSKEASTRSQTTGIWSKSFRQEVAKWQLYRQVRRITNSTGDQRTSHVPTPPFLGGIISCKTIQRVPADSQDRNSSDRRSRWINHGGRYSTSISNEGSAAGTFCFSSSLFTSTSNRLPSPVFVLAIRSWHQFDKSLTETLQKDVKQKTSVKVSLSVPPHHSTSNCLTLHRLAGVNGIESS